MNIPQITFASPGLLVAAVLLAMVGLLLAALRRPDLPSPALVLMAAGLVLLALAAGDVRWNRPAGDPALVLVDVSPSTRTAAYRDPRVLRERLDQLLPGVPRQIMLFSDGDEPAGRSLMDESALSAVLPEWAANRTFFPAVASAGVLLFSDAQFALPAAAPPVHVVVDPGLEQADDAAITGIEQQGESIDVHVRNLGGPRQLMLSGAAGEHVIDVPAGVSRIFRRPLLRQEGMITAQLVPGDTWPENDVMTLVLSPLVPAERWWVGARPAPPGWRHVPPEQMPDEALAYLRPAAVVLDNVPAGALTPVRQERLTQYVRDLGGTLVIAGGAQAFAAGGYPGTLLESLSPLSSSPPGPSVHWMLLVDSSGSMAAPADGATRWRMATEALSRVLRQLPPDDLLSAGDFARELRWWVRGESIGALRDQALPPQQVFPHGPTNLEQALQAAAAAADEALENHLLVLTDAEVVITDPQRLAERLSQRGIRLHVLAVEAGSAVESLRMLAERTGGGIMAEYDPRHWAEAAEQLAQQAMPERVHQEPLLIRYGSEAERLGTREVWVWNRTWLKPEAAALAEAEWEGQRLSPAGQWRRGAGRVIALGYAAEVHEIEALADLAAEPPRDPRFSVSIEDGPMLQIQVDAIEAGRHLNVLSVHVELMPLAGPGMVQRHELAQNAPGRYVLSLERPREAVVLTVRHGGALLERRALAGRYAAEFLAIGNHHANMRELAERTGGRVIASDETEPLEWAQPVRPVRLSPLIAAAGAASLLAGLVVWRVR